MERILVAGATGTTGKQVVELLKNDQYFEPVAMVRKPEQVDQFKANGIETVLGDLTNDLSHTTNNIDKVIFAAGSKGKNVEEVDKNGAIKLIDESQNATVKKFVMLSSMGADKPEQASDLQEYLKAKQAADNYLKNSNLNYSIVRPGSLTDDNSNNKIELQTKLNKHGEIPRADVAKVLVKALHDDVANKETFEIIKGETLIADALEPVQQ
ncbi:NAD-dependent dehydratase [Nonlabens sp. MIC269]|uniref:SDR family oxidoreductase n=1 Tax=Nonlabens sp. MIC269 TaxID=1476901 RepID=UPI0007206D11|nr:SDR family oxidoreductase [Nonlabens sp. MIC269]ALM21809.1 NAD-dependent dehydratase [Nonlabens sp. MIC269]